MRVAVTGGAGYIGSVVSEVLQENRHDVLVLDNLSRGHADAVAEGARFIQVDLMQRTARITSDAAGEVIRFGK